MKTNIKLVDCGMWICSTCGKINSDQDSNCRECNSEKFLIIDRNDNSE